MSSLRERFREGIYDAEHKPRLAFARNYFLEFSLDKDLDFNELQDFYLDWRDYIEYLVLQKQTDSLRVKGKVEKETIAVKCAKRGNDVYWWRVWKRLKFLYNLKDRTLFNPRRTIKSSRVLFVTLTYNIKKSSIREAWENIGEDFNRWIRNLRKKFGQVSYLRCWESSKRGYPHVHLLMFFHDSKFGVIRIEGKYRIAEKEMFEKSWHSFVDVQAVRKLREGIAYITKYLTKTKNEDQSHTLTLALCWLFIKRSFAVSGDFHEAIYTTNIQYKFVQTDLFGNEIDLKVVWVFIGVFPASTLGIDQNEWRKVITDKEVLSGILG